LPEFGTVGMRSAWSSRRVVAGAFAGLAVALILVPKATAADDTTNLPAATDAATAAVTTTVTDATTAVTGAADAATGAAATGAAATGAAATPATDATATGATGATDTTGAVTGTVGAVTGAAQQTVTAVTAPSDTAAAPPATNPGATTTPPPPDSGDATAGTGAPTAKDPTAKDPTAKDPTAKDDKGGAKDTTSKDGADKGGAKDTTGKNNGTTSPGDASTPTKSTTPAGNEQTAATPPPAQSTPVTTQPAPAHAPAAPSTVPLAPPPDPGVAQVRLAPPPLAFPVGLSFFGNDSTTVRHVGFAARWAGSSSDLTSSHEAPGVTTLFATPVAGAPTVQTGTPVAPIDVADSKSSKAPRHATASQARPTKAPPTGGADDERAPLSPTAPPGHGVVAGSVASSGSGAAPVMFFAILLGVLAYAAQELRRHRFRLVVVDLDGIVSPQQRPG
jgi:hypothetical protein